MIKFMRAGLECTAPYGDGDQANLVELEAPDGVPIKNDRTYKAGTLVMEEMNSDRTFITTGQALLEAPPFGFDLRGVLVLEIW